MSNTPKQISINSARWICTCGEINAICAGRINGYHMECSRCNKPHFVKSSLYTTLETQLDEARAENVILQGYANRVQEMALTVSTVIQQREHALGKLENTEEERDEARADVERLRKRVEELEAHPAFVVDLETGKFTPMFSTPTQPEIFEAHGLEWYRHTGTDCPCDTTISIVALTYKNGITKDGKADNFIWDATDEDGFLCSSIIGWRPADSPEKLPRK